MIYCWLFFPSPLVSLLWSVRSCKLPHTHTHTHTHTNTHKHTHREERGREDGERERGHAPPPAQHPAWLRPLRPGGRG